MPRAPRGPAALDVVGRLYSAECLEAWETFWAAERPARERWERDYDLLMRSSDRDKAAQARELRRRYEDEIRPAVRTRKVAEETAKARKARRVEEVLARVQPR